MLLKSVGDNSVRLLWICAEFGLLACVGLSLIMICIAVRGYPLFWTQPGARTFLLQAVCALAAYAVAIVWFGRRKSLWWASLWTTALRIGLLAGAIEIANVATENNLLFHMTGPALQIGSMVSMFLLWGLAGGLEGRRQQSFIAGLLAAVFSAGISMVVGVAAGFLISLFVAPPSPAEIVYWAEFKRSGWSDARAFGIANALDSGFTHLLIAPVVGALLGGVASLVGSRTLPRETRRVNLKHD